LFLKWSFLVSYYYNYWRPFTVNLKQLVLLLLFVSSTSVYGRVKLSERMSGDAYDRAVNKVGASYIGVTKGEGLSEVVKARHSGSGASYAGQSSAVVAVKSDRMGRSARFERASEQAQARVNFHEVGARRLAEASGDGHVVTVPQVSFSELSRALSSK